MDALDRRLDGVKIRGCSDGLVLTWRDQKHGRIVARCVGRVDNEPAVLEVLVASIAAASVAAVVV